MVQALIAGVNEDFNTAYKLATKAITSATSLSMLNNDMRLNGKAPDSLLFATAMGSADR